MDNKISIKHRANAIKKNSHIFNYYIRTPLNELKTIDEKLLKKELLYRLYETDENEELEEENIVNDQENEINQEENELESTLISKTIEWLESLPQALPNWYSSISKEAKITYKKIKDMLLFNKDATDEVSNNMAIFSIVSIWKQIKYFIDDNGNTSEEDIENIEDETDQVSETEYIPNKKENPTSEAYIPLFRNYAYKLLKETSDSNIENDEDKELKLINLDNFVVKMVKVLLNDEKFTKYMESANPELLELLKNYNPIPVSESFEIDNQIKNNNQEDTNNNNEENNDDMEEILGDNDYTEYNKEKNITQDLIDYAKSHNWYDKNSSFFKQLTHIAQKGFSKVLTKFFPTKISNALKLLLFHYKFNQWKKSQNNENVEYYAVKKDIFNTGEIIGYITKSKLQPNDISGDGFPVLDDSGDTIGNIIKIIKNNKTNNIAFEIQLNNSNKKEMVFIDPHPIKLISNAPNNINENFNIINEEKSKKKINKKTNKKNIKINNKDNYIDKDLLNINKFANNNSSKEDEFLLYAGKIATQLINDKDFIVFTKMKNDPSMLTITKNCIEDFDKNNKNTNFSNVNNLSFP